MNKKILFLLFIVFSPLSVSLLAKKGLIPPAHDSSLLGTKRVDVEAIDLLKEAASFSRIARGELTADQLEEAFGTFFTNENKEFSCYGEDSMVSNFDEREILQQVRAKIGAEHTFFSSEDPFKELCPEEERISCGAHAMPNTELLDSYWGVREKQLTMVLLVSGDSEEEETHLFDNGSSLRLIKVGKSALNNLTGDTGFHPQPDTIKGKPWHPLPTPPPPFLDEPQSNCLSLL